jgi:hypothetical protein
MTTAHWFATHRSLVSVKPVGCIVNIVTQQHPVEVRLQTLGIDIENQRLGGNLFALCILLTVASAAARTILGWLFRIFVP